MQRNDELNMHDFSSEIMEAWRERNSIFKELKEKNPVNPEFYTQQK